MSRDEDRKLRVVFATNDRGFGLLKVAVHSLVTHVDVSKPYELIVLEGEGGVSDAHKREIEALIAGAGRVAMRFVNVDRYLEEYHDKLAAVNKGRTLMVWARCFIGEVLRDVDDNVLYLDIDTYINGDLAEVFDVNLGDCVLGMVPEAVRSQNPSTFAKDGFPPELEVYCNSGMTLLNPSRLTRQAFVEPIMDWIAKWGMNGFRCPNQDILNPLFCGRIRFLPPKWNYHDGWVERSCRLSARASSWRGNAPRDVLEAIVAPKVIHFWGRKPTRFNHRPEHRRYERAMRQVGLLDGALPGTTLANRLTLPFWDALHWVMKQIARLRLAALRRHCRKEEGRDE